MLQSPHSERLYDASVWQATLFCTVKWGLGRGKQSAFTRCCTSRRISFGVELVSPSERRSLNDVDINLACICASTRNHAPCPRKDRHTRVSLRYLRWILRVGRQSIHFIAYALPTLIHRVTDGLTEPPIKAQILDCVCSTIQQRPGKTLFAQGQWFEIMKKSGRSCMPLSSLITHALQGIASEKWRYVGQREIIEYFLSLGHNYG